MENWRQELYATDVGQAYLAHHGIKGQRWGVRRYQNEDGSLTPEGRERYAPRDTDTETTKKVKKDLLKMSSGEFTRKYQVTPEEYMKRVDRYGDPYAARIKDPNYMQNFNRADRSRFGKPKDIMSAVYDRRSVESRGKSIVKSWLMGEESRLTYDMARESGHGRVKAMLESIFDLGLGSLAGVGAYATASEGAKKIGLSTETASSVGVTADRIADAAVTRAAMSKGRVVSLQQRRLRNKYNANR